MLKKIIVFLLLLSIISYCSTIVYFNNKFPILKWQDLNETALSYSFPKQFLWGTASAAHQVEGNHDNNNWYNWENSIDELGKPRIHNGDKSGLACDHWNSYPEDIKLMKNLRLNSYRFSISWSKIEPNLGQIDSSILIHYDVLIDSLLENGIEPMITLHHFSHPMWFENLGGFEKEENITHFVEFSKLVFDRYSAKVKKWCTINEPNVFVTGAYVQGNFPPGKKDPALAGQVLFNLLKAHTRVYQALKKHPQGIHSEIGIVKDIFQFDPYNKWDLLDWILVRTVSKAFNDSSLELLKTGKFNFDFPGISISENYPDAQKSYDFVGLNYYSHIVLDFSFDQEKALQAKMPKDEIKTDMEYTIYPEGFYRAIKTISELKVPIYITENGIADKKDNKREIFIRQYLYALSKAINEGIDVRGYYYWSLTDNFEWAEGYEMKFGLYEVDFKTQERSLREGAKAYKEIINRNF